MESAMGKRSGARLAVVIAAAVLLMLLLAAPAMAAPFATSLVASPSHSTVGAGDSLTISAVLTDTVNTLPVSGEVVRVEQASSDAGPWTLLNYATPEARPAPTASRSTRRGLDVLPLRLRRHGHVCGRHEQRPSALTSPRSDPLPRAWSRRPP